MRRENTVVAVIPARGGSKGVPRKNLADLGGRTLVRRAIDCALSLAWIDMTVLSTDDQGIADEGRRAGIEVPSLRPAELATDLASGYAAWRHAHLDAESRAGHRLDLSVLIQPTSPFREASDIEACVDLVLTGRFEAVVTVSPTPAHFAPEKTMVVDGAGHVQPYLSRQGFQGTRQLIPTYYNLNGICYVARRDVVLERENVFGDRTGALVIDRALVNIDDPLDLDFARWLWERR
jgi:CMP-N,N'-diacetyllegionaminic acid synthase